MVFLICREYSSFIKIYHNNLYFTWRRFRIYDIYFTEVFLEMFQIKVVEKIRTHFVFSNVSFSDNHAFYEIMWKDMVGEDGAQITISMAHALCLLNN
jgi:hypothetical protein